LLGLALAPVVCLALISPLLLGAWLYDRGGWIGLIGLGVMLAFFLAAGSSTHRLDPANKDVGLIPDSIDSVGGS